MAPLDADQIVSLYRSQARNPLTALSNLRDFRLWLAAEKGIKISADRLRRLLARDAPRLAELLPRRERFPRRYYCTNSIDELWVADAFFLPERTMRANYVAGWLLVVDALTSYCWCRAFRSKRSKDVAEAFAAIVAESRRRPASLQTDQGVEFLGAPFQQLLASNGIRHRLALQLPNKASLAESNIRVIKRFMRARLREEGPRSLRDALPLLLAKMNQRSLRRLGGLTPAEINVAEQAALAAFQKRLARPTADAFRQRFKVGDVVYTQAKGDFSSNAPAWYVDERFVIDRVDRLQRPYLYGLVDEAGQPLARLWYGAQLLPVENH